MLVLFVNFDDPWYFLHISDPNFATYMVGEVGTALFMAAVLIFWLTDIARHRAPELNPDATALEKFMHESMEFNYTRLMLIAIFYIFLVIDFTILYGMFYFAVTGSPGEGEISFNQE